MLEGSSASLIEGRLRRHPEGGARRGVLRQAACNRLPREARDPARQALRPGCEELAVRIRKATARRCRTAGAEGDGSAAPRPKTATVELFQEPSGVRWSSVEHAIYCISGISLFGAPRRSMLLYSAVGELSGTPELPPCRGRARQSSKTPPPAASYRCARSRTTSRSRPASSSATAAMRGTANGPSG